MRNFLYDIPIFNLFSNYDEIFDCYFVNKYLFEWELLAKCRVYVSVYIYVCVYVCILCICMCLCMYSE